LTQPVLRAMSIKLLGQVNNRSLLIWFELTTEKLGVTLAAYLERYSTGSKL